MKRIAAVVFLFVTACGQKVDAPSLARRPIESRDLNAPTPEPLPPVAADQPLQKELAELFERADAGQRAFATALPRAQAAATAAGAEASESWIAAQQALTALESARAETTAALARVDALLSARVQARDDAGLGELQAAAARISAVAEAQQASIDAVRARISR